MTVVDVYWDNTATPILSLTAHYHGHLAQRFATARCGPHPLQMGSIEGLAHHFFAPKFLFASGGVSPVRPYDNSILQMEENEAFSLPS
jgi:hypothetical protein